MSHISAAGEQSTSEEVSFLETANANNSLGIISINNIWRLRIDGNDLAIEKNESGVWNQKFLITE